MKHIANTLLGTAFLVLTSSASAGGEVRLKPHESKGWMNAIGRVGGYYSMISSEYPQVSTTSPTPTIETGKVSRSAIGFDLDLMGFWDATRFDTLLGAEMKLQLALIKGDEIQRNGTVAADTNKLFFRWDAAFDYGLLHFGTAKGVRGRLGGGAGFGADYDSGRFGTTGGRVYPLLLARAHLFLTEDFGGHLAYHYVPTTTNDAKIREHRFELAGSISSLQAGVRYVLTRIYAGDTPYETKEGSVFVAYAF
ncbi:MAG: hypothetical protein IPJ34_43630 [Myxococcales bacterium]|nr:hypothetical protein [Myxococcales bacterium]